MTRESFRYSLEDWSLSRSSRSSCSSTHKKESLARTTCRTWLNENLIKFDGARKESFYVDGILDSTWNFLDRQYELTTVGGVGLHGEALKLCQSGQFHRAVAKSSTELKPMVSDFVGDQQDSVFFFSETDNVAENEAFFVVVFQPKDEKKIAGSEDPKARAQDVRHVHATMARTEEKETRWRTLGPPNRRQFFPMADVSNRTGTSSSGRDDRPLCCIFKKGSFLKGQSEIADILLSGYITEEVNVELAWTVLSSVSEEMSERAVREECPNETRQGLEWNRKKRPKQEGTLCGRQMQNPWQGTSWTKSKNIPNWKFTQSIATWSSFFTRRANEVGVWWHDYFLNFQFSLCEANMWLSTNRNGHTLRTFLKEFHKIKGPYKDLISTNFFWA